MGDTPPTQPAATWRCPGGRLALRPQPWVGVDGEAESGRESPSVGIRPPPRLLCVLAGPAGRHPHPCLTPLHLLPSHPVPPTAAPLPSLLSPLGLPGSSDLASFPTSPLALYSPHPSPSVLPKKPPLFWLPSRSALHTRLCTSQTKPVPSYQRLHPLFSLSLGSPACPLTPGG